jgi:hypothetical protein
MGLWVLCQRLWLEVVRDFFRIRRSIISKPIVITSGLVKPVGGPRKVLGVFSWSGEIKETLLARMALRPAPSPALVKIRNDVMTCGSTSLPQVIWRRDPSSTCQIFTTTGDLASMDLLDLTQSELSSCGNPPCITDERWEAAAYQQYSRIPLPIYRLRLAGGRIISRPSCLNGRTLGWRRATTSTPSNAWTICLQRRERFASLSSPCITKSPPRSTLSSHGRYPIITYETTSHQSGIPASIPS